MKSATLIKIVLALGLIATLGLIAAGITGAEMGSADPSATRNHVLLGLLTILLLTLSHAWILLFFGATVWAVKATLTEKESLDTAPIRAAKRLFVSIAPWSLIALSVAIGNFLLGAKVFASAVYASTHKALFFGALVAQLVSLAVTARGIRRYDRVIQSVEQEAAGKNISG